MVDKRKKDQMNKKQVLFELKDQIHNMKFDHVRYILSQDVKFIGNEKHRMKIYLEENGYSFISIHRDGHVYISQYAPSYQEFLNVNKI